MSTTGKAQSAPREIKGGFEAEHMILMNLGSASQKTDLSKYIRANRADSRWNGEMPFSETLKIDVGGSGALSHYRMLLTIPISPTREPFPQQDAKSPSIHSATALRVYPHCSPIPPPMPTSPHPTSIPILPHPTPPHPLLGTALPGFLLEIGEGILQGKDSLVGEYQVLTAP